VLAVITHQNAPRLPNGEQPGAAGGRVLQLLQDDQIRYDDQPVAVVVADTLENARRAARLVAVRYQAGTPRAGLASSIDQAYAPDKTPRGPTDTHTGDFERAFTAAPARVDGTYTTPAETHNPMEMHATVAVWQGGDKLTLYDATQGIFGVRKRLAQIFGLQPENVRVICPYLGGGFGCKGSAWSHVPLAAMAARVVGRPVKLVLTRPQMFSMVGHRPPTIQRVALGADREGRLVAMRHDVVSETSRFDQFVEPAAGQTRMLYACPNISTTHRLVRLDVPTPTFTRAPGETSGSYALEAAMDELAYALAIDPLELRLRNYAEREPDGGRPWSSKSLRACYHQGAERFGWSRRRPKPRSMTDGHLLVGWGMATATYPANQSPSQAIARIRADGTALVQAGTQDLGTGTYTIMTQVAADALGLPVERVKFELGDTVLPEAPLSAGSRTASSVGPAVRRACLDARAKLAALAVSAAASPLNGVAVDKLAAADGELFSTADQRKREPFAAIVARTGQPEVTGHADVHEAEDRKKMATHSFGAQFAEVKVDEALGQVRVTRFVGAFGAGKILNAKTARSQFHGGIVWGIGFALHENTVRDPRTARLVTRDLSDYHVPVHPDIPDIDVIMIDETDTHVNEVGAKGIGELGMTGVAAAVANAVYHATGKRVRDLPITPDKLL
jgi:xanthine dehydrogenase YagR molybdenum-binding subunit